MLRNATTALLTNAALVAVMLGVATSVEAAGRYHTRTRTDRFFEQNLNTPPARGLQYYNHWNPPRVAPMAQPATSPANIAAPMPTPLPLSATVVHTTR